MRTGLTLPFMLGAIGALIVGCNPRYPTTSRNSKQPSATAAAPHAASKDNADEPSAREKPEPLPNKTSTNPRHAAHDSGESWLPPLRIVGGASVTRTPAATWSGGTPFTESNALDCIERELQDALKVRPTLVVWLFDQSAAAGTTRRAVASAAVEMHARLVGGASAVGAAKSTSPRSKPLFTAFIAFGGQVNVLTPEPVADASKLPAPESIAAEPAAAATAYAAVNKAAELYAPYRTRGHEVIFVLVAHNAAADEASFNSAVATLSRAAIPVFGIGPAASFGRLADSLTTAARPTDAVGYESLFPERIALMLPGNQGDAELADSGFGPFHLERICRATDGRYLRLHAGSAGWKTDDDGEDDGEIDPELLRKYAPEYVSEAEYKKLLAANRACRAVHEAAQQPPARVLLAPVYDFRKEDDAAMARALSMAQRAAAENQPALERLHETLAAGEDDRARLTRPRWQAAFDLAYGRACAARARNEGYNHMLAVLKNGKAFAKPDSTVWSLKPAEGIAGRSDLDRMAKTAKSSLERVVKEHAQTPWAALAARELETPCGWEWTER